LRGMQMAPQCDAFALTLRQRLQPCLGLDNRTAKPIRQRQKALPIKRRDAA
jgi:hypothetical protein